MKKVLSIILLGFLAISLFSCKKNKPAAATNLVGKWKLVEVFNGYTNGGSFTWIAVSTENSHDITFSEGGQYEKKDNLNGNYQLCSGTYTRNNNDIQVSTNCNSAILNYSITELSPNQLILDRATPEGRVRYKYVLVG